MNIASIIVIAISVLGIIITSIVKPTIKIGKVKFSLYWIIALLGALILLCGTFLPINEFWNGLISNEGMNPLKILILFLSMTCISLFLDELGFFSFLAGKCLQRTKASQIRIFFIFYTIVSVLTIFTSNDIVILTLTPFIISFCKRAKISPVPYLVSEFIAANTWSMMFIIGNPTNIYIATSYNIDFISYLKVMILPTILAGILEIVLIFLLFYKKLKQPIDKTEIEVKPINKALVAIGLTVLLLSTVLLIVSSYIPVLEMWYIALGSFFLLVIASAIYFIINKEKPLPLLGSLKKAPYELIPFLLSMFVFVLTLNHYGYIKNIHDFLGTANINVVYGYSSLLIANLVNNIPMSVLYSQVINGLSGYSLQLAVYSSIIGSNIGAFLTPLGALAGIMWMNILKEHEIKFSYSEFIKYGVVIGVPVATVAIFTILIAI